MKKGFTLLEMAIVLVVIAILLGLMMKGRAIVEAAQMKSEVHKISKLVSAFTQYEAKHNAPPGIRQPGIFQGRTTATTYADLLEGGYLTDADFKVSLVKNGYWNFTGCVNRGSDGYWQATILNNVKNVCAYISFTHPKDAIKDLPASPTNDAYSLRFICYIESIIDDRDVLKGLGRSTYIYELNIPNYNQCNKLSDEPTLSYLYKVN